MSIIKKTAHRLFPGPYTTLARALKSIPWRRKALIRRYLQTRRTHLLQLGCGPRFFEGWINTDLDCWNKILSSDSERAATLSLYMNLEKGFPFPDNSVDAIFSEHVHEHFPYPIGCRIAAEYFRVLKPGGALRIITPSIDHFIQLYLERQENPDPVFASYPECVREALKTHQTLLQAPADANTLLNGIFLCHGHRYLYDFHQIHNQLSLAGFHDIRRCQPGQSSHPHLCNLETNPIARKGGKTEYAESVHTSLIVEAQKGIADGIGRIDGE